MASQIKKILEIPENELSLIFVSPSVSKSSFKILSLIPMRRMMTKPRVKVRRSKVVRARSTKPGSREQHG